MEKKTKSKKIVGFGKVDWMDSACVGCMGRETPYVDIIIDGKKYRWWSNEVDSIHGKIHQGDIVFVNAFIRESTGRLFKVKITRLTPVINPHPMWR